MFAKLLLVLTRCTVLTFWESVELFALNASIVYDLTFSGIVLLSFNITVFTCCVHYVYDIYN